MKTNITGRIIISMCMCVYSIIWLIKNVRSNRIGTMLSFRASPALLLPWILHNLYLFIEYIKVACVFGCPIWDAFKRPNFWKKKTGSLKCLTKEGKNWFTFENKGYVIIHLASVKLKQVSKSKEKNKLYAEYCTGIGGG